MHGLAKNIFQQRVTSSDDSSYQILLEQPKSIYFPITEIKDKNNRSMTRPSAFKRQCTIEKI